MKTINAVLFYDFFSEDLFDTAFYWNPRSPIGARHIFKII